jgi:hypothetical protein
MELAPRAWARIPREDDTKRKSCMDKFRSAGVAVDKPEDPFYLDIRRSDRRLTIDGLPELQAACLSLHTGATLFVCEISHFATQAVALWAVATLARKRAILVDLGGRREWDFGADPGAGYEVVALVVLEANRARTRRARETRAAMGKIHRTPKLRGEKKATAKAMWEDPVYSAADVVEAAGVSEMTLRRMFGGRLEAITKAQGKKA